ncbi:50S ribosomal protein L6 [Candidatus Falkowbacteria bacterium]|uniref:Large ribosomal subunit protein uL6 n=1 Tax=Candidatus Falkowbacteria bacterium CG10_big_fil_rev_8_21_14_0_10_37_18 TaxID=1974562 RepID=A0A2H0V8T2_9BACT|nr:50S ribosomal protein L6 [Candidatus Falkowbacteria bacterium]NCQ12531.1 50S ribosomal protein L6 [Candidatus Falkowbacteria bacterium]OIO05996.1 MAG: 50S ribosomal protein L6 [Candidatus Falkowbacteria bacterium CG1_02_37_21]PIR95517.1 MAG: 50S ribosomal protein L6 [Candidatus Falkowbacteria bacterium CG10_big_fil_rev_8_21_14_0_10_37_18]
MSRLGKLPIKIPAGVTVKFDNKKFICQGPKGELSLTPHKLINVVVEGDEIKVSPKDMEAKGASAFWGLTWSLVRNIVIGVHEGFVRKLEINGVGYRAVVAGDKINMSLGYSHPIEFALPVGVTASVAANVITLESANKGLLGETAAKIRKLRKPEPYKGKGVKYAEEVIRRKAGKAAAKTK